MLGSTLIISKVCEFSRDNVIFSGMGVCGPVAIGQVGNVDLLIPDDCYLTGGQLNAKNGLFGDYADMQVVDVDGKYAPKGYVLAQFQTSCQIIDSEQRQMEFDLTYPAKILGGLYLRVVYHSFGMLTGNVMVSVNYALHKARY